MLLSQSAHYFCYTDLLFWEVTMSNRSFASPTNTQNCHVNHLSRWQKREEPSSKSLSRKSLSVKQVTVPTEKDTFFKQTRTMWQSLITFSWCGQVVLTLVVFITYEYHYVSPYKLCNLVCDCCIEYQTLNDLSLACVLHHFTIATTETLWLHHL